MRRLLMPILVLIGITGCGDSLPISPSTDEGLTLARNSPSGDEQRGEVAEQLALPLRVVVTRDGAPAFGVTVHWIASGDGATVEPTSSLTDRDGVTATVWTLPRFIGVKTMLAALNLADTDAVVFHAEAVADEVDALVIAGGDGQTATPESILGEALRVRVADRYGNPVVGITTDWSVPQGGGMLAANTAISGPDGVAEMHWTLGSAAGTQVVDVRIEGNDRLLAKFQATAFEPDETAIVIPVGNHFFGAAPASIPVGTTVTWVWLDTGVVPHSVRSEDAPGFPGSAVMLGIGRHHSVRFTSPGVYRYNCAVHGNLMTGSITVE